MSQDGDLTNVLHQARRSGFFSGVAITTTIWALGFCVFCWNVKQMIDGRGTSVLREAGFAIQQAGDAWMVEKDNRVGLGAGPWAAFDDWNMKEGSDGSDSNDPH